MKHSNLFWLIVAGASVGWLVGLAETPILSNILVPIITVAITAIAALSGLKLKNSDEQIVASIAPLGVFILSLAVLATAGYVTRINGLFGLEGRDVAGKGLYNAQIPSSSCASFKGYGPSDTIDLIRQIPKKDLAESERVKVLVALEPFSSNPTKFQEKLREFCK